MIKQGCVKFPKPKKGEGGNIIKFRGKDIKWKRVVNRRGRNWTGEGKVWESNISSFPPFYIKSRKEGGGDNAPTNFFFR